MKHSRLMILVVAIVLGLGVVWHLFCQYRALTTKLELSQARGRQLNSKVQALSVLKTQTPVPISRVFVALVNITHTLGRYYQVEAFVRIPKSAEPAIIQDYVLSTDLGPVKRLPVELVVARYRDEKQVALILDSVSRIQPEVNFVINQISRNRQSLVISGELYGVEDEK